jgi:uncharacterized protein (TIGR04255 family)
MTEAGRELFNNNKITEAICQITFKENLESEFVDKFFEGIKAKYSDSQDVPKFQLSFSSNKEASQKQLKGIKASNLNGDKVVQIFSDNVSIHQVGNYQTWEDFREDIYFVLQKLAEISNCEVARIDLRAINKFSFEVGFKAEDYFKICFKYPAEYIQNSNYQFNLEQIFVPEKEAGVVRANCIHSNEEVNFILDLSYINWLFDTNIKIGDAEKIKETLEIGHLRLYKIFSQSITDRTKLIIK